MSPGVVRSRGAARLAKRCETDAVQGTLLDMTSHSGSVQ